MRHWLVSGLVLALSCGVWAQSWPDRDDETLEDEGGGLRRQAAPVVEPCPGPRYSRILGSGGEAYWLAEEGAESLDFGDGMRWRIYVKKVFFLFLTLAATLGLIRTRSSYPAACRALRSRAG